MSVNSVLFDGDGSGNKAKINGENALYVIEIPHPPILRQKTKPFKQFLTTDGTDSGTNDMGVDGSVTNVDYYVEASQTADRYIKTLSFIMGYGTTSKPYLFADAAAITNGCRLFYTSVQGESDIDSSIKTNAEMLRLGNDNVVLSDWEIRHLAANNDYGYLVNVDLTQFSPELGVKLDKGSDQRLIMRIRDDATNADNFNVIAFGFDRFE